jgi:hypothetical protein
MSDAPVQPEKPASSFNRSHPAVQIAIIFAATLVVLTCIISMTAISIAFLVNAPW